MRRLDVDDDASEGSASESESDEDEDEDAALARMMGHARTKRPTPRANDTDPDTESESDEDEDAALARLIGASRRVAVGGAGADSDGGSTDDDSDLRSTTTNGDRVARNKPRKMLKKNGVGRKNARATEPGAFGIIPELEEEGIDVGSEEDSDEETAATRRAAHFEVLDAEVGDDEDDEEGVVGVGGGGDEESDEGDEGDEGSGGGDASSAAAANKGKKPRRAKKGKKGSGAGEVDAGDKIRCSLCRLTFTSGNALHKHLKEAHSGTHKKKR